MNLIFKNKTVLIIGGTGSLGQAMTKHILNKKVKKIIIYSRDELKQFNMQNDIKDDRIRYFIGDVRDRDRLYRACVGVDYIIHAAALKQVPACEYNPNEAIKTNVIGAMNVIDAAIDCRVKKVVALSTDKAVNPINLYGATKLCSDKLFIHANAYSGDKKTIFSVVRYGNVAGSRGSVIPFFKSLIEQGIKTLPVTDEKMTRFYITLEQGINLIETAFKKMKGGEIYVAKIPSFRIIDLVKSLKCNYKIIGIRQGEKLHEIMITADDKVTEYKDYYVISDKGKTGFTYSSDINKDWLYAAI